MPGDYKHLVISKENLQTDRRTRKINRPHSTHGNLHQHGQML
ncbi:hypothetical protein [Photorhabdus stackebrandtii]|nr:hypothetical protein [Photorhabdus stackebrandtii]